MFSRIASFFGFERRSAAPGNPFADPWGGFAALAFGSATEGVLKSPTALACVRAISEALASLPLQLVVRGPNGTGEREIDGPVAQLLGGDWTPWASGTETVAAMSFDALTHGFGAALVIRAGGVAKEIHRLEPTQVARDWSGAEPVYRVDGRTYSHEDVLFVATPGSMGWRVLNLASECGDAIQLDLLMAAHQRRIFTRGARPSGIFEYSKMLTGDQIDRLKNSMARNHSAEASGATMILEDGMTFKPVAFTSVDLQFLKLRKFVIAEIARAYKVPATLIGDLERATWRNVEELGRQFLQMTLNPWIKVWSAALGRALLSPEQRLTSFIRFDVDDLLQADLAARFTALRNAVGGAFLTPDEARAMEHRPPAPGGDKLIMQAGQGPAPLISTGAAA